MTAEETLGSVFPINVTFVQGEQPASGKYTGWANQTSAGLNKIARAIGDIWGEEFEDNKLFVDTQRPTHIMNLARLIGPASALNPLRPVAPASRVEYDVVLDPDDIPINANEFNLRTDCGVEPPIDYSSTFPLSGVILNTSIETALEAISYAASDSVFLQRVASRDLVDADGDYYVDTHGNVLTFNRTGDYVAVGNQTYQTTMTPDRYDQATLNVIPDMNQTSGDGLCQVLSNSEDANIPVGKYVVRAAYLTKLSVDDSNGNPLEPGDTGCPPLSFATTERARLPYALKASTGMNLSDGDQIPTGFMGLWDETDSRLVTGLTFYTNDITGYDSDSDIVVTGATLTAGSSRYRIVTVGTTITETMSWLIRRLDTHTHSTRQSGFPVSHLELQDKVIQPSVVSTKWSINVDSPPSVIVGNDHPQYLCRYGYKNLVDTGQQDNAMLGDMFMASVQTDYDEAADYRTTGVDSRKIYFGTTQVGIFRDYSMGSGDTLAVTSDLVVNSNSDVTSILFFGHQVSGEASLSFEDDSFDGFYFKQAGTVAGSSVQAGHFMVHDETNAVDPAAPGSIDRVQLYVDSSYGVLHFEDSGGANAELYFNASGDALYMTSTGTISINSSGVLTLNSTGDNIVIDADTSGKSISFITNNGNMIFNGGTGDFDISSMERFEMGQVTVSGANLGLACDAQWGAPRSAGTFQFVEYGSNLYLVVYTTSGAAQWWTTGPLVAATTIT